MKKLIILIVLMAVVILLSAQEQSTNERKYMKGLKVLFVLSGHPVKGSTGKPTGWYLSEAAHPWKVLREEGIEIDFMSPEGGKPPVDGFNLEDPVNKEFWEDPEVQKSISNTYTPDQINIMDYAAIHFVVQCGTFLIIKILLN